MDTEATQIQDHEFGASQWVDMGGFTTAHHHTLGDYTGFAYTSSPMMPVEPAYSMSMPQPYNSQHLLPLAMSSQWPSMLSTQAGYTPVPVAPAPVQPTTPLQPITSPHVSTPPTPRRTLTDSDRRRMCLYHQDNPHVKQTEIGAMFGVERSTVSKVLRQKEKYLFAEDGRRSPIKKTKGKFPDIERALANWVRNHLRHGGELSDAMIRDKAVFFANTVGSAEAHQKLLTASWLEKFKRKNNCAAGSMSRKGSVDKSKGVEGTGNVSSSQTPSNILSPASPAATTTPSPASPQQQQQQQQQQHHHQPIQRKESIALLPAFNDSEFTHSFPQDTASVDFGSFTTTTGESTVIFSSENPFTVTNQAGLGVSTPRPRSQTFPVVNSDPNFICNESTGEMSPGNLLPHHIPSTGIEEGKSNSVEPRAIKRNRSNPEISTSSPMQPPPLPKCKSIPPTSPPGSPTQDECRQALELVVSYFQTQPFEVANQACIMIEKLMEKLELAQGQCSSIPPLPPIPTTIKTAYPVASHVGGPRVSKKRSIHTL